jgi:hypothetical protein
MRVSLDDMRSTEALTAGDGREAATVTYRISPKYRWYLRFWSLAGVCIAALVAMNFATWFADLRYGIGTAACFALMSCFLIVQDYRLGRTIKTDADAIHFRTVSGVVETISWQQVVGVANHAPHGFFTLMTLNGKELTIDHQYENVKGLLDEIATRSGARIEEQ